MTEYILQDETYKIRGCLNNVYNELGCGFVEKVYQEALEREFLENGIPFCREKRILIYYKGVPLRQDYYADFLCYDKIIIEVKAVPEITGLHKCQILNYLKATNLDLGLLVNFGETSLKVQRFFNYRKNNNNG